MIPSFTAMSPPMQAASYFPPDLAVTALGQNLCVPMLLPEMMPQQHSQLFSPDLMTPQSTGAFSSNYSFEDYSQTASMQQVNFGGSQYSNMMPAFEETFAQSGNFTPRTSQHRGDSPPHKKPCPGSGFQCPCDPSSCTCERCYTHNQGLDWSLPGFLPASTNTQGYQQMPPHDLTPEPQIDMQWARWRDNGSASILEHSQFTPRNFNKGIHQYSGTEEDDQSDGLAVTTPFELDFSFPLT